MPLPSLPAESLAAMLAAGGGRSSGGCDGKGAKKACYNCVRVQVPARVLDLATGIPRRARGFAHNSHTRSRKIARLRGSRGDLLTGYQAVNRHRYSRMIVARSPTAY